MGMRATGFKNVFFYGFRLTGAGKSGNQKPSGKPSLSTPRMEGNLADLKGLKRICMSCGARFYDLNKKPIICPGCNTEFTGEIKVKARRGRIAAEADDSQVEDDAPVIETDEDETLEMDDDDETVSLEEIGEDEEDEDDDDLGLGDDDLDDLDGEDLDDLDDDDMGEDIAEEDED